MPGVHHRGPEWIEQEVGAERAASADHAVGLWACGRGSRDRRRPAWGRGVPTHPQGVWLISCRRHLDRSFELPTSNCNHDDFDEPRSLGCTGTVQRTNAVLKERIPVGSPQDIQIEILSLRQVSLLVYQCCFHCVSSRSFYSIPPVQYLPLICGIPRGVPR